MAARLTYGKGQRVVMSPWLLLGVVGNCCSRASNDLTRGAVRQGCTQHALHLPCCLLFPTRHRTLCDAHAQRLKVSLARSTM